MSEIPDWLAEMRAITGLTEDAGDADDPKILAMRDYIAKTFPDMAPYCALYKHDSTPWCGLAAAYCMARAGIRPPFGKTDTDRFLWARSWGDDAVFGTALSSPRPGCVVVLTRSGGGHVTFYESTSGSNYICRGGNQSDAVNTSSYPKSGVLALIWPREGTPPPPPTDPTVSRTLSKGDTGADVALLQKSLGIPADGDFGDVTETQVEAFQAACDIEVDGVVGPASSEKIKQLDVRVLAGGEGLSDQLEIAIISLAKASPIMNYNWPDRGKTPVGYLPGMALSFAVALTWLHNGDAAATLMAKPAGGPDTDALEWYKDEFAALGMDNSRPGVDVLRHLWVMLIGLGVRESSGRYFVGKDPGASNTTADTCEAGLFQTSWNVNAASPELSKQLISYWNDPNGFLPVFQEKLDPIAKDLAVYGTGYGATYQWLAKFCPLFAAVTTAIGMRVLRKHWGPINRREVDLLKDVDDLLIEVEELVEGTAPIPEPEPPAPEKATVAITITGDVTVTVNGKVV